MVELHSTYPFRLSRLHFYDCLVRIARAAFDHSPVVSTFDPSVGLAYANVELKTEVHNLSSRVTDSKTDWSTLPRTLTLELT